MKDFILKEEETGAELLLPVTPSGYEDYTTLNAQKVNAYAVGDLNLIGNAGTSSVQIRAFFPTERRSYTNGSSYVGAPAPARELLDRWCSEKKLIRLIIGGDTTDVNRKCFLTTLKWYKGGEDMTDDLHCDITLAYYTDLTAVEVNTDTGNNGRAEEPEPETGERDYIVQAGDTLWDICQAEYGDATLCWQLAEYNGVKNANLIYPGDALKLPPESSLSGLTYTGSRSSVSAPSVSRNAETGKTEVKWPKAGGGGGTSYMTYQ